MPPQSSVADRLGLFLDGLDPVLLSPEARQRLMALSKHLPGSMMLSLFGFELRLNDDPAVDILFATVAGEPALPALAGAAPAQTLPKAMLAQPEWRRIREFAVSWNAPDSPLQAVLDNMWLEFDAPTKYPERAVPLVFFGTESQRAMRRQQLEYSNAEVLLDCATRFFGAPVQDAVINAVTRCHTVARRYGGGANQMGLMLSRPGDAVRLCVSGVPRRNTLAYLRDVGWPGPLDSLQHALEGPCAQFDSVTPAFDCAAQFAGGLSPKLGLECYFAGKLQPEKEPRWCATLSCMVEQGLCLPEKAEALLRVPLVRTLLPVVDPAFKNLPGYAPPRAAMRGLHHLKCVISPEGVRSAKAYIWCSYVTCA